MRAYSLKKVKELVSLYNETKSAEKVAEALRLPLPDVKKILVWLHKHDPVNAHSVNDEAFTLALPTNKVWVQFLYMHNISPTAAAICLNWPLVRLLEMCGGPEEWAKHAGRKPVKLHQNNIWHGNEPVNRRPEDPTAAEIEARKLEVQAMWQNQEPGSRGGGLKTPKRVEIKEYVYDNRDGTFT